MTIREKIHEMEKLAAVELKTSTAEDFIRAERGGVSGIVKEFVKQYGKLYADLDYLIEVTLCLNWLGFAHKDEGDLNLVPIYWSFEEIVKEYAQTNLKGEDLEHYEYRTGL